MKNLLQAIVITSVFFLGCDIEKNSTLKVVDYSNSLICVAVLFSTLFVLYNYKGISERLMKPR